MGNIAIDGVSRSFGSVAAVRDISLDIAAGEFFTLLGPSGCGKTTLLRMIAGFSQPDTGQIRIGTKRIDTLPPHQRNIGMVFQNYAIFPNLTVAGNVAYGLKARNVAAAEIQQRVAEALAMVRLDGLGERWPHQLSGGQLQRVAIARALVIRPEVLLLDEPLSNLDARLRVDMRGEIRALQQRLGITTVYVTHDQEEALAVSQRIAVMRAGVIEQLGPPHGVYRTPASLFVAEFMGTTNTLDGLVTSVGDGFAHVDVAGTPFLVPSGTARAGDRLTLCLRPEAIELVHPEHPPEAAAGRFAATAVGGEFLGPVTRLDVKLDGGPVVKLAILDTPRLQAPPGTRLQFAYDPARVSVFPPRTA